MSWHDLSRDADLWKFLEVPVHFTDDQFLLLITEARVRDILEELDCSHAVNITQDSFVELSRRQVLFPCLRRLIVPDGASFTNVVYEYVANARCFPALEELANVRPNDAHTCDPIRCQAFFKQSPIKVLHDAPVTFYGRLRRVNPADLTAAPSSSSSSSSTLALDNKQRRQRWEQDLAKAAISCQHVTEYRCCRSAGYLDDKSIERLSVLFPNLKVLELQNCGASLTDEGFVRFFSHQRPGALHTLSIDRSPSIADQGIRTIADQCAENLRTVRLSRCPKVTGDAINELLGKCVQLKDVHLDFSCCFSSSSNSVSSYSTRDLGGHMIAKSNSSFNINESTRSNSGSCSNLSQHGRSGSNRERSSSHHRYAKSNRGSGFNSSLAASGSTQTKATATDDSCLISLSNSSGTTLENVSLYNPTTLTCTGLAALSRDQAGGRLHTLSLYNCPLVGDDCLKVIIRLPALRSLTLVHCSRITPSGVINLLLGTPRLISFVLHCVRQERGSLAGTSAQSGPASGVNATGSTDKPDKGFYSDVATLAEHAYDVLSGGCDHPSSTTSSSFSEGGCLVLSELRRLSVAGVGGQFLRLLAVLGADIDSLDIEGDDDPDEDTYPPRRQSGSIGVNDVIEVVTILRHLRSLEVRAVGHGLTDSFLHAICINCDDLRHLAIDGVQRISMSAISDVLRIAPSLACLAFDSATPSGGLMPTSRSGLEAGSNSNARRQLARGGGDVIDEGMVAEAAGRGDHCVAEDGGGVGCSRVVTKEICEPLFRAEVKHVRLTFTPRKFMGLLKYARH